MRCHLSAGGGSTGSTIVEIDDEKVDITEELEELFRRDQAEVKEDIRKFIGERHISQSAIAKATKNGTNWFKIIPNYFAVSAQDSRNLAF